MRRDVLRKEFLETAERAKAAKALEVSKMIERARRRAVLDHAFLTGHEVWDRFLQHVEDLQANDRDELTELERQEHSTEYESAEASARRRHRTAILRERISARLEVIELPRKLMETKDRQ